MDSARPAARGEVSDATLLVRSQRHGEAFREIFDRHHRSIWRFLARRYGRDAADDLTAETFAAAFAARGRYDPSRSSARPWLFGIALNIGRRHRRRERARLELCVRPHPGSAYAAQLSTLDRRGVVAQALLSLSEAERETLLLLALADLSYAEIAEATGVPEGTVRSRLNRARRRLQEVIDQ